PDVTDVRHAARARRAVASEATRSGSWVASRNVRSPQSSASCASRSSAPASPSALYGSSSTSSSGSWSRARQSARRCVTPREDAAAREREIDAPQDPLLAVALAEPSRIEHASSIGGFACFTAVLRALCGDPCNESPGCVDVQPEGDPMSRKRLLLFAPLAVAA